jgi:hypothetical protein
VPKKSRSGAILEFYRRAAEARRMADAATNPLAKVDFLAIEKRWLSLARMRPKRPRRRPAGLRNPSTNSESWLNGRRSNKSWAAPRLRRTHPFKLFAFSRTSPTVRPKNPAISTNDIPR